MNRSAPLRICTAAFFLLLVAGCAGPVEPPRNPEGNSRRGTCRRPGWLCGDFSKVDSLEDRYRLHMVLIGECEAHGRSVRGTPPETVYSLLTYHRYPFMAWDLHDCRLGSEEEAGSFLAGLRETRASTIVPWDVAVGFGLSAVVVAFALLAWMRDLRRGRRAASPDVENSPALFGERGPGMRLLYRVLLGFYAGYGAAWIHAAPLGAPGRVGLYLAIALLIGACFVRNWARVTLAVIAVIHVAWVILGSAMRLDDLVYTLGLAGMPSFLALNVALPLALLAALSGETRAPVPLNLPPGYDYSLTRKRRLSPLARIITLICMIVIGTVVLLGGPMGLLLFAVFVMPVIIGAYLVFHLLTGRREKLPAAQRRFRVSPKLGKPAQTGHYWTLSNSEYQDPDLYEQNDSRPRISREPKEGSD